MNVYSRMVYTDIEQAKRERASGMYSVLKDILESSKMPSEIELKIHALIGDIYKSEVKL